MPAYSVVEQRQLVGLITRRSEVRSLPSLQFYRDEYSVKLRSNPTPCDGNSLINWVCACRPGSKVDKANIDARNTRYGIPKPAG